MRKQHTLKPPFFFFFLTEYVRRKTKHSPFKKKITKPLSITYPISRVQLVSKQGDNLESILGRKRD